MATEIQTFTTIWLIAVVSLIFCRQITTLIPSGPTRLISLLPIIYLFTTLPLQLSHFHLSVATTCYLVWLANSKLILFAFNQGPLITNPPLSLLHFISIGLSPIKPISQTKHALTSQPHNSKARQLVIFLLKCGVLVTFVNMYDYRVYMHEYVILVLYCCHLYLSVELIMALTALPVKAVLGLEIEPQFDEPYLATSLQDFWGRRWNLIVTGILRPTVYLPVRSICTHILGRRWALPVAMVATFLVSGLMHEVIYYHVTRVSPTWEVTWFFVLHGVCVAAEVAVKKALTDKWRLHNALSRVLTLGFVVVTGGWLFFPQIIRHELDLKAINEYLVLGRFVRDKLQRLFY